jgi:hypothetical protein
LRPYHLFLLAPLAACSSQVEGPAITYSPCDTIVVVPGPDATGDELASLPEAIALWNRLGSTRLTLEDVAGAEHLPISFQDAASSFHGLYDATYGIVYINHALVDPHQRAVVIAHELGHAMGLVHITSRASVMAPSNLSVEPNADDASALSCAE